MHNLERGGGMLLDGSPVPQEPVAQRLTGSILQWAARRLAPQDCPLSIKLNCNFLKETMHVFQLNICPCHLAQLMSIIQVTMKRKGKLKGKFAAKAANQQRWRGLGRSLLLGKCWHRHQISSQNASINLMSWSSKRRSQHPAQTFCRSVRMHSAETMIASPLY